jgi:hypothetical protein
VAEAAELLVDLILKLSPLLFEICVRACEGVSVRVRACESVYEQVRVRESV